MRRLALLAAFPALLIGASPASSDPSPADPLFCSASKVAGTRDPTLTKLLKNGLPFSLVCQRRYRTSDPVVSKVTATLSVSTTTKQRLGLKSRVIASGALTNPRPDPEDPKNIYIRIYTFPASAFPSAVKARLKAKRVALLRTQPALEITADGDMFEIPKATGPRDFVETRPGRCATTHDGLWFGCAGGLRP